MEAFTCMTSSSTTSQQDILVSDADNTVDNNVHVDLSISLTPEEERLFQTLENAALCYENQSIPMNMSSQPNNDDNNNNNTKNNELIVDLPDPPQRVEIRIAGGWVRDKILNQASHDVDVALDIMSGLQFATIVQRYLIYQQEQQEKDTKKEDDITSNSSSSSTSSKKMKQKTPKIAVISANPSQSKHLETATMNIHSVDVDFVHLRGGEVYTSDSRIPTLKENATALDDALRRDFTVNSLFYNLRTKKVEDYTGRGIPDLLTHKILATPIDAGLTFHDDPLRVLRAIRFGVRYDLTLSEEIVNAAKSKEVHDSLHVKVSRERVGKELEAMLTGKNAKPATALKLINDLKLAGCIFSFPPKGTTVQGMIQDDGIDYSEFSLPAVMHDHGNVDNVEAAAAHARENGWVEASELLKYTCPLLDSFHKCVEKGTNNMNAKDNNTINVPATKVDSRLLYLSTFLHPFRKLTYIDSKKKTIPITTYIIKDSIKFPNRDVSSISTILKYVDEMRSILVDYFTSTKEKNQEQSISSLWRLKVGTMLRSLKDLWVTTLLVAAVAEIRSSHMNDMEEDNDNSTTNAIDIISNNDIDSVFRLYQDIQRSNLDYCWKIRPLLDGKALVKSLELPRGPGVGIYVEEQVRWMLLNPNGSKNDCEEHLKSVRKRELEGSASEGGQSLENRQKGDEKSTKHCSKKAHIGT